MNILSQNYNNLLRKMIFDNFSDNLKKKLSSINNSNNVFNYIAITSNLDEDLNNMACHSLIEIFESLDEAYKKSEERKRKYDIKAHHNKRKKESQRTDLSKFVKM